jgi:hypothetical protein
VHAGARPKAAPEYIGATNRANRRCARLADYDELIEAAVADERRVEAELDRAAALLEDLRRARRELPHTRPVARAAEAVGTHAALLARAREEVPLARRALATAIADLAAKTRQPRQATAARRRPPERSKLDYAEAEAALDEANRLQQALEEEFRTLEETLQADVQHFLEQIRKTERLIKAAQQAYAELDRQARTEHDNATAADRDLRNGRQSLAEAIGQLYEQAAQFGDYARPDLRPLVGVTTPVPWPGPATWPAAERASADLTALLTSEGVTSEGAAVEPGAIRGVLPADVTEILDSFTVATRGGRQVTEGTLKNTADRMSVALKDFTEALAACDEDYRVDWEPRAVVTVHVIDDEGRKPVARFATRIADRAADQGVLLEDRERKASMSYRLRSHSRSTPGSAAREGLGTYDTRLPMSSGIAVGIRWGSPTRSPTASAPRPVCSSATRLARNGSPSCAACREITMSTGQATRATTGRPWPTCSTTGPGTRSS